MDIIKKFQKLVNPWQLVPQLSEKELEDVIRLASDSYYNSDISLISDEIFDALKERLELMNPNSSVLHATGAPVRGKKVKLPYWMGSMDKIKGDEKTLTKWIQNYSGPYLISDKLDGISCLLVQNNGKTSLYTRGDGTYGQDISHLINFINIPSKALKAITDLKIAIRGELIMSIPKFEKYTDTMANARNMVGGIVNMKPSSIIKKHAADVDFITYEIITAKTKLSDQLKQLKKMGFDVVYYDIYDAIDSNIIEKIRMTRKKNSLYEIDGIIVTDNNKHTRNTDGNPPYSFAYKGVSQTADVKVLEILWKPSKDGILVPRIRLEKTRLSGVDIQYTAGFNARFIVDKRLGPGAIIRLVRSGDTIPHILDVIKPAKKVGLPIEYDYQWDVNKVNFVLRDVSTNKTVIIQRMTKFVKQIGVDNMSEGIVTKLVNAGIDTIPKLLKIKAEELLEIDGFGEILADKIVSNLGAALEDLNVLDLMVASNIFGRGYGYRRIEGILNAYPNIVDIYKPSQRKTWYDKLIKLDGFDSITVDGFLDGLPFFQKFYDEIKKIIFVAPYEIIEKSGDSGEGILAGEAIVFTGFREKNWIPIIEREGGVVDSDIRTRTTLLVYKEGSGETTSKYIKAKQKGIQTIPYTVFAATYGLNTTN